jgi:hypothetical protein
MIPASALAKLILLSTLTYNPPRLVTAPPPSAPFNVVIGDTVLAIASINEEGAVSRVNVMQGVTPFTDEAVKAINQWHFAPAHLDGHTVASEVSVLMMFRPHAFGNAGLGGPTFGFTPPEVPPGDHPVLPHFIFDPGYPLNTLYEGVVVFELDISESGRIDGIGTVRDFPATVDFAATANFAAATMHRWIFTPAVVNGIPVRSRIFVAISFVRPVLQR